MKNAIMGSKTLRVVSAVALALALVPTTAVSAFANDGQTAAEKALDEALAQFGQNIASGQSNYDYADNQVMPSEASLASSFPEKLDLRDKGYVTDVRFQNPWGTCWAFGITAASEISILSESSELTADTLDLSERHLSWFAKTHLPDVGEAGYDPSACDNQSGEGTWYFTDPGNSRMDSGDSYLGLTSFSAGVGIVTEYTYDEEGNKVAYAPYRNDESTLIAKNNNNEEKTFYGEDSVQQAMDQGYTKVAYYSKEGTWALDESKRFSQSYTLEESNVLPSVTPDENGDLNQTGVNAFKKELSEGRGISIGFTGDAGKLTTNRFNRISDDKTYYHYVWAQNPELSAINHGNHIVTIVGWDDTIDAKNFTVTNPVKWDTSQRIIYRLKATGECLKNDAKTGKPLDPVTGEVITDSNLTEAAREHGAAKTDVENRTLCTLLSTGEKLEYVSNDVLQDSNGATYQLSDLVRVVFCEDGTTAKRDAAGNVLYQQWSLDGQGTGSEITEISDKTVVEVAYEDVTYTPKGNGAWIVKNSWGSVDNELPNKNEWGNQGSGYFYLSYYDNSVANAETFDFAVSEDEQSDLDYSLCYGYNYMSASKITELASTNEIYTANVFTASENCRIKNVSCETSTPGITVEYQVYKLRDNYTNPADGELVATASKTYEYAGYHRADLDVPVYCAQGEAFSVVVTEYYYDTSGTKKYVTCVNSENGINSEESTESYAKGVVNEGESYIAAVEDGYVAWQDWSTVLATDESFEDVRTGKKAVDNFGIKAYADPVLEVSVSSEGATFTKGGATSNAVFTFGEDVEGFGLDNFNAQKGVSIDGTTLDAANYCVMEGSIKLVLYKEYLNTLAVGTHTLRLYLNDSESASGLPDYVDTTLTVTEAQADSPSNATSTTSITKTGDATPMFIIIAVAVVALAGVVVALVVSRRRSR